MSTQMMPVVDGAGVLAHAHREWATRPADESFLSLEALHAEAVRLQARAREAKGVKYSDLRVQAEDGDLKLVGKSNIPSSFTHWSFGQLAQRAGFPAAPLRDLPATLAGQVLNYKLANKTDGEECKLLLDVNGSYKVRALTSPDYARIFDVDITKRALKLADQGWNPAPETDLAQGGKTRGLYKSDHDVFMFLVDSERRVFEKAPGGGLSRGIMIANSEVGDKSFWFLTFLYSYICANHNVWGVDGVSELRIRHVGSANERAFGQLEAELKNYATASAQDDELKIQRCMNYIIGQDKDTVLDTLFGMKSLNLSRKLIDAAYQAAEEHESWYLAPPTSAWGIGNGLTEVAQTIPFTDERVKVERAAGKIFELSF